MNAFLRLALAVLALLATPAIAAPNLIGAFSRKPHGAAGVFEQALVMGGAGTVESRALGGGHLVVLRFDGMVNDAGNAFALDATGQVVGNIIGMPVGNEVHLILNNM